MQVDGLSELDALKEYFICQGKSVSDAEAAAAAAVRKSQGEPTAKAKHAARKVERKSLAGEDVNTELWRQKAGALVEWAHQNLLKDQAVLSWLETERGLTLDTVNRCKLGWNPSALFRDRKDWGIPDELNKNGRPKKVWIPAGLVIPGYNSAGNLTRVKIRQPDDQRPADNESWKRYAELSGSQREFIYFGDSRQAFIVVESELDAILIDQEAGDIISSVSTGSAANRADNDADLKTLSSARVILVSLDSDEAGEKAAVRAWKFDTARLWLIPDEYGKDHTEATKNGLPLRAWIEIGLEELPEPEPEKPSQLESDSGAENVPNVSEPAEAKSSASGAAESQTIKQDQLLIIEAVRLQSMAGEADHAELERALNTLDLCQGNQDNYNFALSVLGVAVEDARARIDKLKDIAA
jgi:DNA primase